MFQTIRRKMFLFNSTFLFLTLIVFLSYHEMFTNNFQDKHVKEKQISHWKEIISLQEKLKTNQSRIPAVRDKIEDLHKQYKDLESAPGVRDVTREFNFRYKIRHILNCLLKVKSQKKFNLSFFNFSIQNEGAGTAQRLQRLWRIARRRKESDKNTPGQSLYSCLFLSNNTVRPATNDLMKRENKFNWIYMFYFFNESCFPSTINRKWTLILRLMFTSHHAIDKSSTGTSPTWSLPTQLPSTTYRSNIGIR